MSDNMKTPEQLTVTKIGSSAFSGQTGGIGSVMGSTWSERIVFDAQPDRVLSKYFLEFNDLLNNNDVTIIVPKIGDVSLMGGRTNNVEGTARTMTAFDSADNITVSLTSADVKLGGASISFETANATRVSIIEMAHKQLVRQYLNTLETDAEKILREATVGASAASSIYAGSTDDGETLANAKTALADGDIIDVDVIVDMRIALQNKDFAKNAGEAVLFIHPMQLKPLLKSSQFTNAAEFGSASVIRLGAIEEYIGVTIEKSTLVTGFTDGGGASVVGHYAYMIDPSAAAGIVWKEKARVKVVTEDDERIHKVLLDAWYRMFRINEESIVVSLFADN